MHDIQPTDDPPFTCPRRAEDARARPGQAGRSNE